MRWGWLVPRVVLVALVWAFFAFAFDPLVRRTVIAGGQAAAGARVDVATLETSFFPPSVTIGRTAVADASQPGINLVEFERLDLRIAGEPLLHRRYVVREGTLSGVQWGTPRDDSGQLDTSGKKAESSDGWPGGKVSEWVGEQGQQRLNDLLEAAKSGLDPRQLESVRLTEQKQQWWDDRFATLRTRLQQLEQQTRTLRDDSKNAKGNAFEKLQTYQQTAEKVRRLLAETEQLRRELTGLPQVAQVDYREIDAARQRDQARIMEQVDAFRLDRDTLTRTLLGPELSERLQQSLSWLSRIGDGVKRMSAEPEPDRYRGIDVVFDNGPARPRFLIERLLLSGRMDYDARPLTFEGTVTDITSSPALHGVPSVATITAGDDAGTQIQLQATLDETGPVGRQHLLATVILAEPREWTLGRRSDDLQLVAHSGRTGWTADIELAGQELKGTVALKQTQTRLRPVLSESLAAQFAPAVQQVTDSITELEAEITLSGTLRKPRWTVYSPLGDQLAGAFNSAFRQEVDRRKGQLLAQMNQQVEAQLAGFEKSINSQYSGVLSQLDVGEQQARELIQRVAGKPQAPVREALRLFRR